MSRQVMADFYLISDFYQFKSCITWCNTLTLWNTQEFQIEVPKLHNMVQYQDM